jgi:hypothetical protein
VVSDDGRGGGFDRVVGVCRCVALVGRLEHAEIVVAIAEADDPLDTQQFLHHLDGAAFACIAVVNVQPAPLPAFPGGSGVGHQMRLVIDAAQHRLYGFAVADGIDVGDSGVSG